MVTITQESFDALNEHWKQYATAGEEGVYTLDLASGDAGLKSALEKTKQERNTLRDELASAKSDNEGLVAKYQDALKMSEGTVNKEKYEALEASYAEQAEKLKSELQAEIDQRQSTITKLLIDSKASEIGAKVSELAPDWIASEAKNRMQLETTTSGETVVRILDKEGQVTALSQEDLINELKSDEKFKAVVTASKANGGDAEGGKGAEGSKTFSEYSNAELKALAVSNKAEYDKVLASART